MNIAIAGNSCAYLQSFVSLFKGWDAASKRKDEPVGTVEFQMMIHNVFSLIYQDKIVINNKHITFMTEFKYNLSVAQYFISIFGMLHN